MKIDVTITGMLKAVCSVVLLVPIVLAQTDRSNISALQPSDILERRLCDEQQNNCSTFYEIFADDDVSDVMYLAFSFTDLPGGFAALPDASYPKIKFVPRSLKLKDVLDSVVAAEPRYKWEVSNGVVNLLPASGYPMLDVRVKEFNLEKANVREALVALKETPEFRDQLAALNITEPKPSKGYGFIFGGTRKPLEPKNKFSVHLMNMSVREILNEIVREDGCAVWSYTEWQPSAEMSPNNARWYTLGLLDYCPELPTKANPK